MMAPSVQLNQYINVTADKLLFNRFPDDLACGLIGDAAPKRALGIFLFVFLILLALAPARATEPPPGGPSRDLPGPALVEPVPTLILPTGRNPFFSKTKEGLSLRLPVFSYDPNDGPTYGLLAVWVVAGTSSTIKSVHAPFVTYNTHFGVTVAYQYFHFPSPATTVSAFGSLSQYWNRAAIAEYDTRDLNGTGVSLDARAEHSRDGSRRFYGIGPASPQSGLSNYTFDTINSLLVVGLPFSPGSRWSVKARNVVQADEIEGSFPPIPDTVKLYPDLTRNLQYRRVNLSNRLILVYDDRDSVNATSRGTYGEAFIAGSRTDMLSAYNYTRYGATFKTFLPTGGAGDAEPRFISAFDARFENINGSMPFWLMPELGGKYSLRSYGEGRFFDHSMIVVGAEERCRVYSTKISGLPASFWIDPFVGLGTVASEPDRFRNKYMRPAAGVGLRVVSRPQMVESLDLAYGQEGLTTFFDFNYAF